MWSLTAAVAAAAAAIGGCKDDDSSPGYDECGGKRCSPWYPDDSDYDEDDADVDSDDDSDDAPIDDGGPTGGACSTDEDCGAGELCELELDPPACVAFGPEILDCGPPLTLGIPETLLSDDIVVYNLARVDADGDAFDDVFAVHSAGATLIRGGQAPTIEMFSFEMLGGWEIGSAASGDFDRDGALDVAVATGNGLVVLRGPAEAWSVDDTIGPVAAALQAVPWGIPDPGLVEAGPGVLGITADGLSLLSIGADGMWRSRILADAVASVAVGALGPTAEPFAAAITPQALLVLDSGVVEDGDPVASFPIRDYTFVDSAFDAPPYLVLADLRGEPIVDAIRIMPRHPWTFLEVFVDAASEAERFFVSFPSADFSATGDVDADGQDELVIAHPAGSLGLIEATGDVPCLRQGAKLDRSLSAILVADLDGDDRDEIIYGGDWPQGLYRVTLE